MSPSGPGTYAEYPYAHSCLLVSRCKSLDKTTTGNFKISHWDHPRTAPTARIRLVTYNNWFAVPHGTGGTQEKGYPPGMPNYIKPSGGIPFSQVKQLIRFRTGAHHLRVETERWVPAPARLPRSERVCQKCTLGSVMEDEYHVLFECPTYHHIRLKYEVSIVLKLWRSVPGCSVYAALWEGQCLHEPEPQEGCCLCIRMPRL